MSPNTSLRNTPLLVTLALGVFAGALDLGVLSPALPAIGSQFAVGTGDLAWIYTLYLLATVASIAVASTLADRYGRRPVYLGCLALFALGSVIAIIAPNYGIFLLARTLQALGAGGIFPVATAAIGDVVPAERRGAALGMVAATWGLAAIVGPLVGGVVTHAISWRWIFAANVPLAAFVGVRALRDVPLTAPHTRGPLDVGGLTLLVAGLLGMMYGMVDAHVVPLVTGALVLGAFAFWQRHALAPIVPPRLFTSRQLTTTYVLELLIGMLEGALFFIPTVLVNTLGISFALAGAIAAIGAIAFVAVIPVSGRLLDRIGSRDVLLGGTLLAEIGLAAFALGFSSLALAIAAIVVAGIGFGALLGAPTRYIVTSEVDEGSRATAVGLLSQFLIVGQIVGGSLAGGIMALATSEIAGYRDAYLAFAAVALGALIVTTFLRPRRAEIA